MSLALLIYQCTTFVENSVQNSSAKVIIIKDLGFVVWAFWANQKTNRPILRLDWRLRLGRVKRFQIQTHKLWGFLQLKLVVKHQYLPSEADHHKPAWLWNGCLFCTHVLQPLATFFYICFSSSFLVTLLWKGFSFNEHKWYRKWTWRLTTT